MADFSLLLTISGYKDAFGEILKYLCIKDKVMLKGASKKLYDTVDISGEKINIYISNDELIEYTKYASIHIPELVIKFELAVRYFQPNYYISEDRFIRDSKITLGFDISNNKIRNVLIFRGGLFQVDYKIGIDWPFIYKDNTLFIREKDGPNIDIIEVPYLHRIVKYMKRFKLVIHGNNCSEHLQKHVNEMFIHIYNMLSKYV